MRSLRSQPICHGGVSPIPPHCKTKSLPANSLILVIQHKKQKEVIKGLCGFKNISANHQPFASTTVKLKIKPVGAIYFLSIGF